MSVQNTLAKIISFLFHPLILPSYAVLLMFIFPSYLSNYQYEYKRIVLFIIFMLTFVFPVLVLMVMVNLRTVTSLTLRDRQERTYPYAVTSIIYIAAYYLTLNFSVGIPAYITNFILTSAIIIFILLLINFKIKVSAHMAGFGGLISYFFVFISKENLNDHLFPFNWMNISAVTLISVFFFLAALTASSRLQLGAHKGSQLLIGFLTGLIIGMINLFF